MPSQLEYTSLDYVPFIPFMLMANDNYFYRMNMWVNFNEWWMQDSYEMRCAIWIDQMRTVKEFPNL